MPPVDATASDADATTTGVTLTKKPAPGPSTAAATRPSARPSARPSPRRVGLGIRVVRFLNALWRPAILLGLLFALWWWVAERNYLAIGGWRLDAPDYLLPTPPEVLDSLRANWSQLMHHSWVTLYETVTGFVIACLVGLVAAVLIAYSPTMDKALYPVVLVAQVIPKIAIAPLLVVWFEVGDWRPKMMLAALIAFFPVVVSGVAGFRSTDPELLDLSATMGAGPVKTFYKIRFPNALPHLMSGFKVAITLAVVGAVVGEFVGAGSGLGYVLLQANGNVDPPLLYADLFLMSIIGILLFVLIEAAEALLIPWHASRRSGVPLTTS
jgi:NitT/TauT family transport system permease protein